MRYALISDIHGNLHALDLVLADLRLARVDQIVCLGDVASLGPQPRQVIARLRELQIPCVRGNHEDYLLDLRLTETHHPWLRAAEQWCFAQLTPEDLEFLRACPPTLSFPLDAETALLCFHGSPRSNEDWLYPTAAPDTLDNWFAGVSASVRAGGHTHVQMARQHRGALILNPGSVGMPFEHPAPGPDQRILRQAEYALLERTADRLTAQLCRRSIDFAQLAQTARASGLPGVDFWLSTWAP